jgi:hypothetical protein
MMKGYREALPLALLLTSAILLAAFLVAAALLF